MANGVTDLGFVRPRLPEIRRAIVDKIRVNLANAGYPDDIETRPDSLMGVMIDTFADREAALWEVAEGVYYSMYPGSATGVALDRAVSFAGVERLQAEPSQCFVVCYGLVSTLIPAGSQIRNRATNSLWQTTEDVTISTSDAIDVELVINTVEDNDYTVTINGTAYTYTNSGGSRQDILNGIQSAMSSAIDQTVSNNGVTLRIVSNIDGFSVSHSANLSTDRIGSRVIAETVEDIPEAVVPGDLNHIVTLVSGWEAVDNLQSGTVGRRTETDAELRSRYRMGVFRLGASTLPAIEANIFEQVLGVEEVRVFENRSDITDVHGLPPHSIQVVVDGGLDDPIAEVIYRNKAAGIDTHGQQQVTLQTPQGAQTINFDRAERVFIWLDVHITRLGADEGEVFPANGFQQIRDYIGAVKLPIGFDVLPDRFNCEVFKVPGIESVTIEVYGNTNPSADPSGQYQPGAWTIDRDQIAIIESFRVAVTD